MIITAFNGSHQKTKGNTGTMVEAFLQGAARKGAITREIRLAEKRLDYCRAWLSDSMVSFFPKAGSAKEEK